MTEITIIAMAIVTITALCLCFERRGKHGSKGKSERERKIGAYNSGVRDNRLHDRRKAPKFSYFTIGEESKK